MKDSLKLLIVGLLVGVVIGFALSKCGGHHDAPGIDTVSVKVVHDTIIDTVPVPVEVRSAGAVVSKLPIFETQRLDSVQPEAVCEQLDSAAVLVPLEQKVYEDSTYRAVVSGYNVSLDTMTVYRQREYITQRIKPPAKRWGLSVGIGAVVGTDFKVRPGVFVGVTYNFMIF